MIENICMCLLKNVGKSSRGGTMRMKIAGGCETAGKKKDLQDGMSPNLVENQRSEDTRDSTDVMRGHDGNTEYGYDKKGKLIK